MRSSPCEGGQAEAGVEDPLQVNALEDIVKATYLGKAAGSG